MATLSISAPEVAAAVRPAQRPARWLHVVSHTDPRYGGLSAAVPSLAAEIGEREGVAVALAAFCVPGEEYTPASLDGAAVGFWPTSRLRWWRDKPLRERFATAVREADGLHIHGLWEASTAMACQAARALGKPYVLSAHGMLEPWALATKRLKKTAYAALVERANVRGAACLHALTEAEATQYRQFGATGAVAVIPNAVRLPEDTTPELFLGRFPALRSKRLVLFLSRLHPKKGLDLLLAAWAQCGKLPLDAHLVIAGPDDGGMQAKLAAQAAQLGIADRLTFTGMLAGEMKWSALAAAACFVLPSRSEGLPMALLEAMGMSVPVIATRACNMPEISEAGAGWEVDTDAGALASALGDFFAAASGQNEAKGQNGARLVAERYTPERVARQMAAMYDSVLRCGPALGNPVPGEGGAR